MNSEFPKLFVTDLDGTALGGGYEPYARFSEPFCKFLDQLDSHGCRWAINTTWDVNGQWQLVLGSPVKSRPLYLMGELGFRLAEIKDNQPVMVQPYTEKMETRLAEISDSRLLPLIQDVCGKFRPVKMYFYGHLFHFVGRPEDAEKLFEYAQENYQQDQQLNCVVRDGKLSAHPAFLEKARSLEEVVRCSGFTPGEVVVAGDEIADTTMMCSELATYSICPENANQEVKDVVLASGGEIGKAHSGDGIIDAFARLADKNGWNWNRQS